MQTASTMQPLGSKAPDFSLRCLLTNQQLNLQSFAEKDFLLVMFICNHCPFVMHIKPQLSQLGKDYANSALAILAISANDALAYPDDSPEKLKQMALDLELTFPIAYDESQQVAKAFQATCTPDFFLYDQQRSLVYRGQLDDARPGNQIPVTGADLRTAIDHLLRGEAVSPAQKPSVGCNIKWKTGV